MESEKNTPRKYKEWGTCLVNNLSYIRPATPLEQKKQVPQSMKMDYPGTPKGVIPNYKTLIDVRKNHNKYWLAECVECGAEHVVRADKIKGKRCKCKSSRR